MTLTVMPKYEAYKDSGVEWIGDIPKDWELTKLGTCLTPVSIKNRADLPLLSITRELGVIERDVEDQDSNHNFIPDDLSGYKVIESGQFGMNKMKAWQGSYGVSKHTGIVSPAYYIFKFKKDINPEFFHWAIRSHLYISFFASASDGVRIGQWDLSKDRMKEIPFVFPKSSTQIAIAKFLNEKTTQIDEAIAIKEQQIALLNERKQILIQQAVTQGLDPTVPMKDSGVEWIGKIPEHWDIRKFKFLANVRYGLGQPPKQLDDGLKIIRATNVERGRIVENGMMYIDPKDIPWDRNPTLKHGEIIVVRSGAYTGDSALVTKDYDGCIAGYDMVATPISCSSEFLAYALLSHYVLYEQIYLMRMRSAQPHLNAEELNETLIALPPDNEQLKISRYIDRTGKEISASLQIIQKQIEKLKEYKTTLINSAVTGKIKVV